jgi:hypothetical protein
MMAELTLQTLSRAGLDLSLVSAEAATGDTFDNDGETMFVAKNTMTGTAVTATFAIQKAVDGQTPSGRTVSIGTANPSIVFVGPFPTEIYNDSDGEVSVSYSAGGITVGAVRV